MAPGVTLLERAAEVKARLRDPGLLGLDGLRQAGSTFKARCVWHLERTPSLSIRDRDGRLALHCFGCGLGGTVLDAIAAVHRLDTRGADFVRVVEIGERLAGIVAGEAPKPKRVAAPTRAASSDLGERQEIQDRIATVLRDVAPLAGDRDCVAYLRGRGFAPGDVPADWAARPPPADQRRIVEAIVAEIGRDTWREMSGLASRDGAGFAFPSNRMCIPWRAAPGELAIVGAIQRRRIEPAPKEDRYRSPASPVDAFPVPFGVELLDHAPAGAAVVLVEGAIDQVALLADVREAGLDWTPLALGSATNWRPAWSRLVAGRAVAIGLDAEPTGDAAATKLLQVLARDGIEAMRLSPRNGKDWAEEFALRRNGEAA